ncbi:MAG: reverse transcriptase domain-containing protein [Oscillospiraceae bacterium]
MASNNKHLKFAHVNVRSLLVNNDLGSRLEHLEEFIINELNCDILACTETHLDNDISENEISIDNYNVILKNRNRFGGGVCIYIRDAITYKSREDLEYKNLEIIWIEVHLKKLKILFGVCYRPPGQSAADIQNFLNGLEYSFFNAGLEQFETVILTGDFNDPALLWDKNHFLSDLKNDLLNLTKSFNFDQLIKKPTRGKVILDLIFTNKPDIIINTKVLDPIHELDHRPIFAELNINVNNKSPYRRNIWHYKNGDYDKLKNILDNTPWTALLDSNGDVNDMVYTFSSLFNDIMVECIPNYNVKISPKDKKGMTQKLKTKFKDLHKLHKKALKSQNIEIMAKFKEMRKIVKSEWKAVQYNYYLDLNMKMNDPNTTPKEWWKISRSQMGLDKIKSIPLLVTKNQNIISDENEKCKLLNEFFVNETQLKLDPNLLPEDSGVEIQVDIPLEDFDISPNEILKIMDKLDVNKASGPDGIGNRILKICKENLSVPLAKIFNRALKTETFPSEWKKANVLPIFKHGERHSVSNYRPISLLSSVSKIFERVIYNKIYEHCLKYNILTIKNSGFKKLDSTINQLIHITNLIYEGLDDGFQIGMIFLDIQKAFDKIWHNGLLHKLNKYGIRGRVYGLLKSYLSGRLQRVILNGSFSEFLEILSGVPQGSIIGPLLFLLFLNDIVVGIDSEISLFADDTSLFSIKPSLQEVEFDLNNSLLKLELWSKKWHVSFNPLKSHYMVITNKKKMELNLVLNNTQITRVTEHKHLGIVLMKT